MRIKWFAVVLGVTAVALIWKSSGGLTALGVFMLVWAHNCEKHDNGGV